MTVLETELPRIAYLPPAAFRDGELYSPAGDEAIELASSAGLELIPWQRYDLRCIMAELPDGTWAAKEAADVCSRQNGKGGLITARQLWGLFSAGEAVQVHTAHKFDTAAEAYAKLKGHITNTPDLERRVAKMVDSHGSEAVHLKPVSSLIMGPGRKWVRKPRTPRLLFMTRSGGSGRGFSGETVYFDEAYMIVSVVVSALMPIQLTKPNSQILYFSSAVNRDEHPHGLVLARVRRRALAGGEPGLCYLEHSAVPESHTREVRTPGQPVQRVPDLQAICTDPVQRALANPALGYLTDMASLDDLLRKMGTAKFAVEMMSVSEWPTEDDETTETALDVERWQELVDAGSEPGEDVAFAVDVPPSRSGARIGVCGRNGDGRLHVEVVDSRPGTGWVAARLAELVDSWSPVAVALDPRAPAGSLCPALEEAGVELELVDGTQYAAGCGGFYDDVRDGNLAHLGQPELDDAVGNAAKRPIGNAWGWDRRDPAVDISPLVAVTLARQAFLERAPADGDDVVF